MNGASGSPHANWLSHRGYSDFTTGSYEWKSLLAHY